VRRCPRFFFGAFAHRYSEVPVAWFIGQSAVMILLAFLLGLLVGWIIWGRRVRALYIEVRMLRVAAAECEANHSPAVFDEAPASETAAAVHIPAPRAEVTDAQQLDAHPEARQAEADAVEADAVEADATVAEADVTATDSPASDSPEADLTEADVVGASRSAGIETDEVETAEVETTEAETTGVETVIAETTAAGTAEAVAADTKLAPVDDLVRIEGIGPKIAAALVAAGIRTYRQLADAHNEQLTHAIRGARIRFAPSLTTWSQQARLLADGDEAGFIGLTDRLIAGRHVNRAASSSNGAGRATVGADTAADTAPAAEAGPAPAPQPEPEPEPLSAPDDLARIEGIGPKIATALVATGIRTYRRLADADEPALTKAINDAGITFAPSLATWSDQARLLADGDENGFAVLTARLIAGRRADDDLERIEGIGPAMAAALHSAGIRTYRALADCSDTRLRNAISGAGLSFAPSIVTWARQARLLADGDEDGFSDLTRRLVAGRDEGRV
jgi:predicted flap endonuclease-1-like 5' DNA nuclease